MLFFSLAIIGDKIHLLPIISAWSILLGTTLSYVIAAMSGHSIWILPFVSGISSCPPEACVYSLFMHLVSFSCVAGAFIRLQLDVMMFRRCSFIKRILLTLIARVSIVFALLACVCVCVQSIVTKRISGVGHVSSAVLLFVFSGIYYIFQVVIGLLFWDHNSAQAGRLWSLLKNAAAFTALALIYRIVCVWPSHQLYIEMDIGMTTCNGSAVPSSSWQRDNSRYWYALAAFTEWIMVFLIVRHFLIEAGYFRRLSVM